MQIMADQVEYVIGVDTHRDHHTIAVLDRHGVVRHALRVRAERRGYTEALRAAGRFAPGSRLWAIESSGSYGAGLVAYLQSLGERVGEVDRPRRPARRNGAKDDELDAERAAREALGRRLADPRARGAREGLRALMLAREGAMHARRAALQQLRALIVTCDDEWRTELRRLAPMAVLRRCAGLRPVRHQGPEREATAEALRALARRVIALRTEADRLEVQISRLVKLLGPPALLSESGVGPITGARILLAWSHPGRLRSEAAFASLAGASPIPASSGMVVRHRLNRGGDRQLNRALHTVVVCRIRAGHAATQQYIARRLAEGKSPREIKRCLVRYLARRFFRLLAEPLAS
jgi:transposase